MGDEDNGFSQKYMLINLAEDPSEKRNVSQKYPDKVLALKALHQRWLKEVYHQ